MDKVVKHFDSLGWFEIFAGGGLAAVILFSVGIFMLVIPVVGLVAGPALMITAVLIAAVHAVLLLTRKAG